MTDNYLFVTNGIESYTNPELNEELCAYYSNKSAHSSKVWRDGSMVARVKPEWAEGSPKRKSCKHCGGRGYQSFTGRGLASIKACRCVEPFLNTVDDASEFETSNPLEFLS